MRNLVLHIGMSKTGTSTIQRTCSMMSTELLQKSVLYPENGRSDKSPYNYYGLYFAIRGENGHGLEEWDAVHREVFFVSPRFSFQSFERLEMTSLNR